MASALTTHDDGAPFPFLKLPSELRQLVYHFLIPHVISPRDFSFPLGMIPGNEDAQKASIALFLTNKEVHEEVTYALYRHSHFLFSIDFRGVACAALESPILWERNQTERMSIKPASSIRHIDIDLEWGKRHAFIPAIFMDPRLNPLLDYVCEHVRALQCLQTLTVRWKKDGILNSPPMVEEAIFILGPLEELQADLPKLQIAVRATQKESNNGTGDSSNGLEVSVKLLDYLSELRGMGSIPIW